MIANILAIIFLVKLSSETHLNATTEKALWRMNASVVGLFYLKILQYFLNVLTFFTVPTVKNHV